MLLLRKHFNSIFCEKTNSDDPFHNQRRLRYAALATLQKAVIHFWFVFGFRIPKYKNRKRFDLENFCQGQHNSVNLATKPISLSYPFKNSY